MPIDILAGNVTFRAQIEQQVPLDEIVGSWKRARRPSGRCGKDYLLY
jgi:hypothetical protein